MTEAMKYRLRILQGVACALATGGTAAEGTTLAVWAIGLRSQCLKNEHHCGFLSANL